jgi:two-component system, LytTR family, response regulator
MVRCNVANTADMKLKCIAIDDEPLALELLEDNIRQVPYLELVAGFNKPMDAMLYIQQHEIDLVFLDIQMPGITGIQFIQSLSQKPMYILVTAYEKFALEGYNLNVVDYLLKPVAMDRFVRACNKAMEFFRLKQAADQSKQGAVSSEQKYIFVNADYKLVKVEFDDIIWIEALKDYLKIHLRNNKNPLVTRMSMKSIEEQLPVSEFIRIHKSYIISKSAISAVKKTSVFINDMELPVGELYRDGVHAFIGGRLEDKG